MGTLAMILAGIGPALEFVNTGLDIANRISKGTLTDAEAKAEWARTNKIYAEGKAAWDAAGTAE